MEDRPIAQLPSDIPDWSENFALAGYDPRSNIGVFLHIGRWRKDPMQWREMMAISLPDGSIIAHRAIGDALAGADGPGGPNVAMKVLVDGKCLQWRFRGGARRLRPEALRQGQLRGGPGSPVDIMLDFESALPIWSLSSSDTSFAGHGHIEQIGRLQGEIRCGLERFLFDAEVNRDHSRGPRLVGSLTRHLWFHGVLENGIRFLAYTAHEGEEPEPRFAEASVIVEGAARSARLTVGPQLPDADPLDHLTDPIDFALTHAGGTIRGSIVGFPHTACLQFTAPWDSYVGAFPFDGQRPNRFLAEQSVVYRLEDGTGGHGHLERTVPGQLLHDEDLERLSRETAAP